jgi:predicted dehydrogenase
VDDDAFIALRHEGGVLSHLWMSAVAASLGPRYRVLGLGGAYERFGLDPQEAQLDGGMVPSDPGYGVEPPDRWGSLVRGDERTPVPTERGAYPRHYEEVAAAIRGEGPPPVSPEDAIGLLEILEAAIESASSGEVVALERS